MKCLLTFLLLAAPIAVSAQSPPDRIWSLDQSTLTYHMSHPLHEVDGVSHAARGSPSRG